MRGPSSSDQDLHRLTSLGEIDTDSPTEGSDVTERAGAVAGDPDVENVHLMTVVAGRADRRPADRQ